jgi:hypothetical protein
MKGIWLFFTDKRMFCIGFLTKAQTYPQFAAAYYRVFNYREYRLYIVVSPFQRMPVTVSAQITRFSVTISAQITLVIHIFCG